MGFADRCLLALLALLVAAPAVHAKKCTDTSGFDAAMEAVEAAVPCADATKHGKYVKSAKKALGNSLTGACKKQFVRDFIAKSTCGRPGFVVCCETNKKGKNVSKVVKNASKCKKGTVCTDTNPTSVGDGCTAQGTCVTTTTTTTTTLGTPTTETPTTTTSSTTLGKVLEFSLTAAGGTCGDTRDASNAVLANLTCGGLNIGGGGSVIPEGPTPDGSVSRFALECTGSSCTILPTAFSLNPPINTPGPDCTDVGCNFGTPLPIPNPLAGGSLTVCVQNTWAQPASGTLDLSTGSSSTNVPLQSDNYLTGNLAQPCPRCSATGTPAAPGTGTCDRGPRTGMSCTTTNSGGITRDCPTGGADAGHVCTPGGGTCIDGAHVGAISVNLSPLTTGASSKSDPGGLFCPNQGPAAGAGHLEGCFGKPLCRSYSEQGVEAGPITQDVPATATLVSTFCIAATGNGLVDASADLPGPGAVSLPGQFVVKDVTPVTTTTSIATTTVPTTTTAPTTLATTTTVISSTTTTTSCPAGTCLDFSLTTAGGTCGTAKDGTNTTVKSLTCGGLNIGGGASIIPEGPTPDGSQSRFALSCTGSACNISANTTVPAANTAAPDCTNTGCNFGTPLPIPNPLAGGALTVCVLNTWASPATGTLDLTTGVSSTSVPLTSDNYITGNLAQPCPRCSATGTPASPGHGTCDRGPNTGGPCTTTSSTGLTRDCPTGGVAAGKPCTAGGGACVDGSHVGPISVNLSPLTTGSATSTHADGLFCPGQGPAAGPGHLAGCFGQTTCQSITENGAPAGVITPGSPSSATLASVFCIAGTGNGLVDASADLPGPGAVSLPGQFLVSGSTP